MNLDMSALLQLLAGASLVGFGADHFRLRGELSAFKTEVAKGYATNQAIDKVIAAVEKTDSRVESMIELLYAIKGQMGAMGHDGTR